VIITDISDVVGLATVVQETNLWVNLEPISHRFYAEYHSSKSQDLETKWSTIHNARGTGYATILCAPLDCKKIYNTATNCQESLIANEKLTAANLEKCLAMKMIPNHLRQTSVKAATRHWRCLVPMMLSRCCEQPRSSTVTNTTRVRRVRFFKTKTSLTNNCQNYDKAKKGCCTFLDGLNKDLSSDKRMKGWTDFWMSSQW
jgi:hypothetical protein